MRLKERDLERGKKGEETKRKRFGRGKKGEETKRKRERREETRD